MAAKTAGIVQVETKHVVISPATGRAHTDTHTIPTKKLRKSFTNHPMFGI